MRAVHITEARASGLQSVVSCSYILSHLRPLLSSFESRPRCLVAISSRTARCNSATHWHLSHLLVLSLIVFDRALCRTHMNLDDGTQISRPNKLTDTLPCGCGRPALRSPYFGVIAIGAPVYCQLLERFQVCSLDPCIPTRSAVTPPSRGVCSMWMTCTFSFSRHGTQAKYGLPHTALVKLYDSLAARHPNTASTESFHSLCAS